MKEPALHHVPAEWHRQRTADLQRLTVLAQLYHAMPHAADGIRASAEMVEIHRRMAREDIERQRPDGSDWNQPPSLETAACDADFDGGGQG